MRLFIMLGSVLISGVAYGQDSIMTKIVTKDISPDVVEGTFNSCPKTIYICGEKHGRFEECPDSTMGLHMLVVYNNGDIWMANLFDNTGQHVVDPGPKIAFSAPIFAISAEGNPNDSLDNFAYGKEISFLKAIGAKAKIIGDKIQKFNFSAGGYSIAFYVDIRSDLPLSAAIFKDDTLMNAIQYLEYTTDLKYDSKLFEKPAGIVYEDTE